MKSIRATPDPDALVRTTQAATPRAKAPDRLAFYRLLASFPWLASYRAKLFAVAIVGTVIPTFVLLFVLVVGAGRLSLVAVLLLVLVLAIGACAGMIWAYDKLVVPLERAAAVIDDVALGRPLSRSELPGSDEAAQVLRGVEALVARIGGQADEAARQRERDELTGLLNRRTGRERGQALIDRECARGRVVRAVIANLDAFAAFNERHGSGHGDALLKAIGARLARLASDQGVAVRWYGDTFLLLEANAPGQFADANELLGRPIVVKGSADPMTLALGLAETAERMPFDALVGRAEAALRQARSGRN